MCWSPLTAGSALRQDRACQDRGHQDEGGEWRVSEQEGSHEGPKGEKIQFAQVRREEEERSRDVGSQLQGGHVLGCQRGG